VELCWVPVVRLLAMPGVEKSYGMVLGTGGLEATRTWENQVYFGLKNLVNLGGGICDIL
jgi:hypothetical protein